VISPTYVESSAVTVNAFALASERHRGQRRKSDNAPFLLHPLEVGAILHTAGASDHVVAAAILHDVLEKSDTGAWEVEARCGAGTREIVEAVSEDPNIEDRGERKAELRRRAVAAGPEAALVFAADKISKLREWRMRMARGEQPPAQTMFHYRGSLEAVAGAIPEHPLVDLLRFELEALAAFPPVEAERRVASDIAEAR
jgi:GTP diphosphokinase / guanosine-3',5'-bis(diphosphate) 3'-diphosphatase